ncbi:MAG: MotA/TolQ/ExbB proton channel family protein [Alteromonadaceae bacterium]|nr:MotA/TolQ/ExbB proton channel family protein [Alteromonadaceae bacterium]
MSDLSLQSMLYKLQHFIELGGNVVIVILAVLFVLWFLILERYYYIYFAYPRLIKQVHFQWQQRSEHSSWRALQIRNMLIAQAKAQLSKHVSTIKTLISLCPLLGLLGTVIGMIDVFTVLGNADSTDPKIMAAGISKSTIPTMVGLVVSLSGVYFISQFNRLVANKVRILSDKLPILSHHNTRVKLL